MKRLGLIGLGQFGQLAAKSLVDHFHVTVNDIAPGAAAAAAELRLTFGPLSEVASSDIVVVATPVSSMYSAFSAMAPYLRRGALVVDVGSVKITPSRWMVELLPSHLDLVATHPLFGPQSARAGLAGLRLVVCPLRGERYREVAAFGRSLGLRVTVTTPERHDEEMAYVQALTHLIGRTLSSLKAPDGRLKTASYQHLLDLRDLISTDTFELFTAIQKQNPFASTVVASFMSEADRLLREAATAGDAP